MTACSNLPDLIASGDSEISALWLLRRAWSRRWVILAALVLAMAAGGAYNRFAPKLYRAGTQLMPTGSEHGGLGGALGSALGAFGGLASLAGVSVSSGTGQTDEAIAVLRSRGFGETFMQRHGVLPGLFPADWDAKANDWKADGKPDPEEAARRFSSARKVTQDRKTNIVSLTVDARDPSNARTWANELVKDINAEMRRRAIQQANASLEFLRRELDSTTEVGTRAAINELIAAQINRRMIANITEDFAFRIIDSATLPGKRDLVGPGPAMTLFASVFFGLIGGIAIALAWPMRRPRGATPAA